MNQSGGYSREFIEQLNNAPRRSRLNFGKQPKIIWVIVGLALTTIVVLIAMAIFNNLKPNLSGLAGQLIARTNATKKLSTDYHRHLNSTSLRATNATMQATLTQLANDATEYRKSLITNKKDSSKITPLKLTNVEKQLDTAILNENLDRKFSSEIRYQLNQIAILMQQLNRATKDQEFKQTLEKNYQNLQDINNQIKNIQLD